LYRTGDLARSRADGTLEFLGRLDGQIKLRGFRIELGEIESVVLQHASVRETAVILGEGPRGDRRLVAWIVPASGGALVPDSLRDFLAGKLPEYMVPSTFLPVETLPLTPNGKVDRRALAARPWQGAAEPETFVPPRDETEQALADLWRGVLGVERISVERSFFDLGGHSLLATQLMSRIRDRFRIDLPLRSLFERPTIAGLAAELAREACRPAAAPPTPAAILAPISRDRRRMKLSDLEKS
ncbi:MAG: phosphopantetheine-binding protein, partial [Acidobacteria bacterium]|nr:phosphopantetheine-binding protein [Acidobacteriota bacterium]